MITTTSAIRDILKKGGGNASACGMTGREALLMSEPEEDMPCSEQDCCQERKKSHERK